MNPSSTCKYFKLAGMALILILMSRISVGQEISTDFLHKTWKAEWICVPETNSADYGVYCFRKNIEVLTLPQSFPVFVSGDNRYKLFVNGQLVSLGPARGDLAHWCYETVDLAPFLQVGQNILAAQVWNEGKNRAESQISYRTAFVLQGVTSQAQVVNTNNTWKCIMDSSYAPLPIQMNTYYVAGPGEYVNFSKHFNGWKSLAFNDKGWKNAKAIQNAIPKNIMGEYGGLTGWLLVPSLLPQMELTPQRLQLLVKAEGVTVPANFPSVKSAITIPPNTVARLLLDQSFLTNAYPALVFSGGKNTTISVGYQEALYTKFPEKGNRNETDGKILIGRKDSILSDGTSNQSFTTLSWRTYRYVQLVITTKDSPFVLEDIYGTFTGYPFQLNAKLESENPIFKTMLDVGWRTARLCAMETYMDCPYYEQLQYIGDTRIQALISLFNSGDDRLVRNALNMMDCSRLPEGLTSSRYPSANLQVIPTFSLWYIGMLHDCMMYGGDIGFVKNKLPGARQTLNYFKGFQQADGSLKNVPYWLFVDWVQSKGWQAGRAPVGEDGYSALMDLQLLWAYQVAADMEYQIGLKENAAIYNKAAAQLKSTIQKKYWDNSKMLYADRTEKDLFSQHANALAILTGLVSNQQAGEIANKIQMDSTIVSATIYFKYYVHSALVKAGKGNDYMSWLDIWRKNLAMGLTTWAEDSELNTTRSDCHAWGASPNIEFFRIILGINSDAPGFSKIRIEPHLGEVNNIAGEMPHPMGKIKVKYTVDSGYLNAAIELPSNTAGNFVWKNKKYALNQGDNSIKIKN